MTPNVMTVTTVGACMLLGACGGGGGSDVQIRNLPSSIPENEDLVVATAGRYDDDILRSLQLIRVVDNDTIWVTYGETVYELERDDTAELDGEFTSATFSAVDSDVSLSLLGDNFYGEHAGLARLRVGPGRDLTYLLGNPDAFADVPDSGAATYIGSAMIYQQIGETQPIIRNTDLSIAVNFTDMSASARIDFDNAEIELVDAVIIDADDGAALFGGGELVSNTDDYAISDSDMSGAFFGEGAEVGGWFGWTYEDNRGAATLNGSVAGMYHADAAFDPD